MAHLCNDVGVTESNCESVFGRVVLILVLDHETLAGVIVSLALSPPLELDLVALVVSPVLDHLHERLRKETRIGGELTDELSRESRPKW